MRENRTSGSVRGALGNRRSYREMKALFHAGKIIERLQNDGIERSDRKGEIGAKPHKGRVSYEEVIQTAKDVVKQKKKPRH